MILCAVGSAFVRATSRSSLVVQMASQPADLRTIWEPPYSEPARQSALPIYQTKPMLRRPVCGLQNMRIRAIFIAAAMNLKRLAAAIAGLLLRSIPRRNSVQKVSPSDGPIARPMISSR